MLEAAGDTSINANQTNTDSESSTTTHRQSQITIRGHTSIDTEDTNSVGGNLDTNTLELNTDTLTIESVQDTENSESETTSAGVSGSTSGGLSGANASEEQTNANSAWTNQTSGISTNSTSTINTNTINLTGGVIEGTTDASNQTNLTITAQEINTTDLKDTDQSETTGTSAGVSGSGDSITAGQTYASTDKQGTTHSTIAGAHINLINTNGINLLADLLDNLPTDTPNCNTHSCNQQQYNQYINYLKDNSKDCSTATSNSASAASNSPCTPTQQDQHTAITQLAALNTDTDKTQTIQRDWETDRIDTSVTIDTRVFTEEGRKAIADDFKNSWQGIKDLSDTAKQAFNQVGDWLDNGFSNLTAEDISTTKTNLIDTLREQGIDDKTLVDIYQALDADALQQDIANLVAQGGISEAEAYKIAMGNVLGKIYAAGNPYKNVGMAAGAAGLVTLEAIEMVLMATVLFGVGTEAIERSEAFSKYLFQQGIDLDNNSIKLLAAALLIQTEKAKLFAKQQQNEDNDEPKPEEVAGAGDGAEPPEDGEGGKEPAPWEKDNRVPKDKETFLAKDRYKYTGRTEPKGSKIYRDDKGHYYHRDTFHKGKGSEIEVYDKNGRHIGTANPKTGKFDSSTAVKGRSLTRYW